MCAITGMPAPTIAATCGATRAPPSSLTACAPLSFMNRTAVPTACAGLASYEPKGRSATTRARLVARTTARASGSSSSTATPTDAT